MDTTASSFTLRKNAKRAAEAMIRKGTAPAVDYAITLSDDGRFEIVWKIAKAAPATDKVEIEIAEASVDQPAAASRRLRPRHSPRKSCDASPFFKIEARPLGERVRFFAQVASGAPCAQPPMVTRTQICRRDLPLESWTTVQVRLNPAHDASGRVDIWLNGAFCGAYRGPMADPDHGARRNGAPFVNTQPRFGIYRDWRLQTQTIYFDKIR
jgi:hypothetical protein